MKAVTVVALSVVMAFTILVGSGSHSALAQDNAGAPKLAPDIHPDSLSRMPRTNRDELKSDEEKAAFDKVAALSATVTAKSGVLGPTGTRAQIPELALAYREMFGVLTKQANVEPKYFEFAVLVATRESGNTVEWNDHEANGIKLVGADIIEAIRTKQEPKGMDDKEALILKYSRELYHQPKVSSATFADMEKAFGRRGTLGIALTMGYYTANALLMHTYDQQTDPARKRPFPDLDK